MGLMDEFKKNMADDLKKEMLPIIEEMQRLRKSIDKLSNVIDESNKIARK